MSKVFVISDTWFNRPIEDDVNVNVSDYNDFIINNWNEVVGKTDDIYILGGFGISNLYSTVIKLNGKIHFLNNYFIDEEKEFITTLKQEVKNSIDSNLKNRIVFENKQIVVLNQLDAVLSYFPLSDWIGKDSGTFCFHGLNEDINIQEHSFSCNSHKWEGTPVNIVEIIDNVNKFEDNI